MASQEDRDIEKGEDMDQADKREQLKPNLRSRLSMTFKNHGMVVAFKVGGADGRSCAAVGGPTLTAASLCRLRTRLRCYPGKFAAPPPPCCRPPQPGTQQLRVSFQHAPDPRSTAAAP